MCTNMHILVKIVIYKNTENTFFNMNNFIKILEALM